MRSTRSPIRPPRGSREITSCNVEHEFVIARSVSDEAIQVLPWSFLDCFASLAMTVEDYGHFTSGGIDDRIESTLPPVLRPKMVPRS